MTRWRTQDGHTVEVIALSHTGNGRDGAWIIVRRPSGHVLAESRSPGVLTGLGIDLAGLTEEGGDHDQPEGDPLSRGQ